MQKTQEKGDDWMNQGQLAIATIPMQKWGGIYPDGQALKTGTIFEDLDKPFFAVEGDMAAGPLAGEERESLMKKLCQVSFVLDDLILYLDTHPDEQEAIKLYNEKNRERMELKKEFAAKFSPLTRDCMTGCDKAEHGFCWQEGPSPWEGVCV